MGHDMRATLRRRMCLCEASACQAPPIAMAARPACSPLLALQATSGTATATCVACDLPHNTPLRLHSQFHQHGFGYKPPIHVARALHLRPCSP